MMNQQQNAASLAEVLAPSLVGNSQVWNLVKHRECLKCKNDGSIYRFCRIAILCMFIAASKCYCFDRCLYLDGYIPNGLELKANELKFICGDSLAINKILLKSPAITSDGDICYASLSKSINTGSGIQYSREADRLLKLCDTNNACIRVFVSSIDTIKCVKAASLSSGFPDSLSYDIRRNESINTPEANSTNNSSIKSEIIHGLKALVVIGVVLGVIYYAVQKIDLGGNKLIPDP